MLRDTLAALERRPDGLASFRRLGDHVRASLRKGDPVVIKGRFRARTFEDKTGQVRTVIDIVADTVGHDLNRGIANYMRRHHPPATAQGDPAADGSQDMAEDRDMIDEEAIERFGRELDESLNQAELAAQALEEDEAADATVSAAPPVPF